MSESEPYEYCLYEVETSDRPLRKDGYREWKSETHPDHLDTYMEAEALAKICLRDAGKSSLKRARVITYHHVVTLTEKEFKPE